MNEIVKILLDHMLGYDFIIVVMAVWNLVCYFRVRHEADKIYKHFNAQDRIVNLNDEVKRTLRENTRREKKKLAADELLDCREKTNKAYAFYSNFTTMFPLLGMLGTVVSLLFMTDSIGTAVTESFFAALTSTFWGIVAALVFKFLDASISYKIEDNEKHMEYILNPNRNI